MNTTGNFYNLVATTNAHSKYLAQALNKLYNNEIRPDSDKTRTFNALIASYILRDFKECDEKGILPSFRESDIVAEMLRRDIVPVEEYLMNVADDEDWLQIIKFFRTRDFDTLNLIGVYEHKAAVNGYTSRDVEAIQELTLGLYPALYEKYADERGGCTAVESQIVSFYTDEFEPFYIDNAYEYNSDNGDDFLSLIDRFCEEKRKQLGVASTTEKKTEGKTDSNKNYFVVQITEDFSQYLMENYEEFLDSDKRSEFIASLAAQICSEKRWEKEDDITAGEIISQKISEAKRELAATHARFHVGQEVWFYNWDLEKFVISEVTACEDYALYDLAHPDSNVIEVDQVMEKYIFASPDDFIAHLQSRRNNGEFEK